MAVRSRAGVSDRWRAHVAGLLVLVAALCLAPVAAWAQTTDTAPPPDIAFPAPAPAGAPSGAPTATQPAAEKAPPVRPLLPPADPAAADAYKVLDTHCARCHQGGRLQRPTPAARLGNILRLDEIARDPALVRPGNPDASRLYTLTLRRRMPFDVHQEQNGRPEPTAEELLALRTWIARLKPVPACQDRRFVTIEAQAEALKRAAAQAGPAAPRQRFVSLAHIYNACASPEAMFGHRQAVVRLFNSLSWKPGPVRVEAIDDARTLLRVDLDDLGWVPAHWDRILRSAANGPGHLVLLAKDATEPFGVAHPVVRGDWLADTVLRAPLYYDLLGLPGISGEVARILQIDAATLRRIGDAQRDVVKASAFAAAGRLVERLGVRNRALWTVYDAAASDSRRDLTETPLTAAAPTPAHDAALSLFLLPNGLPAYLVANGRGDRLDQVPAEVVRPGIAARKGVRAGLDCMGCHGLGPTARGDEAAPATDIARAASRDREFVRESLAAVGIEPGFTIDGLEPITALVREFRHPLAELRAANELGLETGALTEAMPKASGRMEVMLRRLASGLVERAEFETEFRALLGEIQAKPVPPDLAAAVPTVPEIIEPGPALMLLSDRIVYKAGDPLRLTVRTKADCHLTLISVDQRGRGTVIYPSDFEPNNLLTTDRELQLPGSGAPYVFRLKDKGRETIVAVCSATGASVDGIRHDFERQRFTDLGDYAAFLTQAETQAAERRQSPVVTPPAEPKGRGRRRPAASAKAEAVESRPRPDQITHTAITIEIR
ncbi:MAG: DUF4384 domain-containing protein [Hyphomicrobiaceae bacterium]